MEEALRPMIRDPHPGDVAGLRSDGDAEVATETVVLIPSETGRLSRTPGD